MADIALAPTGARHVVVSLPHSRAVASALLTALLVVALASAVAAAHWVPVVVLAGALVVRAVRYGHRHAGHLSRPGTLG